MSSSPWILLCRGFASRVRRPDAQRYVKRQMTDEFATRAREHSFRARSAFKLMELDDKFRFLKKDSTVIDVGCAPGSWCQVVAERCHLNQPSTSGYLLGVDLQMVLPVAGADILSLSDVTDEKVVGKMRDRLGNREVDVVLSDMAPNPTGDPSTDHRRLIELCRTVFRLFHPIPGEKGDSSPAFTLSRHGVYVCKVWDGVERKEFMSELRDRFKVVKSVKPSACRESSAEMYLYCSSK